MRSSKLLTLMLVFIGSTVGWAAGAKMGTPIAILGSVLGSLFGWVAARAIWRKLF